MMTGKKFKKGHTTNVGKKNARKLNTNEQMKCVYESYCDHLSKGKVKKSWWFDDGSLTLTWETMEKYLANEPHNFDPLKKEVAVAKGMSYWENVVEEKAKGKNKDADTAALQMVMRNKYGWDKPGAEEDGDLEPYIKTLTRRWRGK